MKNLLLVCAIVLASTSLFGQTVSLKITGFASAQVNVKSANLELVKVKDARGQKMDGFAYVISRNQDNITGTIMSDISMGKSYSKAELIVTLKNGTKIIHDLTGVAFAHYTSTNISGKTPMEQFYLQFGKDVVRK